MNVTGSFERGGRPAATSARHVEQQRGGGEEFKGAVVVKVILAWHDKSIYLCCCVLLKTKLQCFVQILEQSGAGRGSSGNMKNISTNADTSHPNVQNYSPFPGEGNALSVKSMRFKKKDILWCLVY